MDKYTATEQAFKHGYEKGYEAGKKVVTDNNVGSKWIPVSERLPEVECYTYSIDVLFSEHEEGIHVGYVCFETGAWTDRYSRDIYADYKVTHWMPLPEPPKEDEWWQIMKVWTCWF